MSALCFPRLPIKSCDAVQCVMWLCRPTPPANRIHLHQFYLTFLPFWTTLIVPCASLPLPPASSSPTSMTLPFLDRRNPDHRHGSHVTSSVEHRSRGLCFVSDVFVGFVIFVCCHRCLSSAGTTVAHRFTARFKASALPKQAVRSICCRPTVSATEGFLTCVSVCWVAVQRRSLHAPSERALRVSDPKSFPHSPDRALARPRVG